MSFESFIACVIKGGFYLLREFGSSPDLASDRQPTIEALAGSQGFSHKKYYLMEEVLLKEYEVEIFY